ncbi:hypothetical protein A3Q56_06139, partial [Intoshia linei]
IKGGKFYYTEKTQQNVTNKYNLELCIDNFDDSLDSDWNKSISPPLSNFSSDNECIDFNEINLKRQMELCVELNVESKSFNCKKKLKNGKLKSLSKDITQPQFPNVVPK